MKKLIFLINSLSSGGAEKVLIDITSALANDFKIEILTLEKDRFYEIPLGIKHRSLSNSSARSFKIFRKIAFMGSVLKFFYYLKKTKPDYVISFMEFSNFINIFFANLIGIKSIITVHVTPRLEYKTGLRSTVVNLLIEKLYKKATHIVSVSNGVKNALVNDYKIPVNKITTIYNPLNLDTIRSLANQEIPEIDLKYFNKNKTFITIGRLIKQKGHYYLIKAFEKVCKGDSEAKLVIIGEGELRPSLEEEIKKYKLENNVFLIGNRRNVFPYLKKSNYFVLPSLWEGFGIVLIEALSQNLFIISADCKVGPSEVINSKEIGVLVNDFYSGSEDDFVTALEKEILGCLSEKHDSLKGFERANDFSLDEIKTQWINLINKIN